VRGKRPSKSSAAGARTTRPRARKREGIAGRATARCGVMALGLHCECVSESGELSLGRVQKLRLVRVSLRSSTIGLRIIHRSWSDGRLPIQARERRGRANRVRATNARRTRSPVKDRSHGGVYVTAWINAVDILVDTQDHSFSSSVVAPGHRGQLLLIPSLSAVHTESWHLSRCLSVRQPSTCPLPFPGGRITGCGWV
jgi:hypothetical protein